jgi:uncharacterized membrane protein (DUF485 family)
VSHSTTEESHHSYREMPTYVKIIVLAQAATILSLTLVMYQVYLNDVYFQQYVISLFQSSIIAEATLSIVTASVFALGTFTLLGSMGTRRANKEWSRLSEEAKAQPMPSLPILATVERPLKPRRTSRRPRTRKPRADVEKLYDSIRFFADDHGQE